MPADLHSSLSDLKRARIRFGILALQDVFVYASRACTPALSLSRHKAILIHMRCVCQQPHQCMLCYTAKCHIAVLFPVLPVEGEKRKHINRCFKYIHCIALPNPMKTVPRITAVHISFERIARCIRSALYEHDEEFLVHRIPQILHCDILHLHRASSLLQILTRPCGPDTVS